ncbi:hypothetical protein CHRY9293_02607 [Chryseobacterium potabilaquae]|uniref:Uncharacterized protein n=1 Tax=Chryseobacterium potabilaquae TaxID=2675057 RepID=A0A6N4XBX5_9FLAO|nr:hypothetical protein CHRY9293_02607 [Chryseobacterium potabilaquae]
MCLKKINGAILTIQQIFILTISSSKIAGSYNVGMFSSETIRAKVISMRRRILSAWRMASQEAVYKVRNNSLYLLQYHIDFF